MPEGHDLRSLQRRSVYLGEGLEFEVLRGDQRLVAEAIDLTCEGLGLAVTGGDPPAPGELVNVRCNASDTELRAVVRHVGRVRDLPRIGLALVPDAPHAGGTRFDCPPTQPAFATAASPWFPGERLRFRIVRAGADGMTLRAARPTVALLSGMELEFDLHLAFAADQRARGRVTAVRRPYIDVEWVDPARTLHHALADYLLAARPGAHARRAAAWRAGRREPRARRRSSTTRPPRATATRSSRCACAPIRPKGSSPRPGSTTSARRSTRTRAT